MEEGEVDFIINEFLGNLGSVESEVVLAKSRRICHVHWWDGWENKPEVEPEDLKALKSELYAILERTGAHMKVVMEELRKWTRENKTGESVRCMVLAYYKMASHISGSNLNDTNNLASKVHRMLQLEYFEEHEKFPVVKDERENEKFVMEEDEMVDQKFVMKEDKGACERFSVEEYSRCLTTEDLRSVGIIELKEARESWELKAAHDPEAFGMVKNKDSDDLLLQIAAVEAEWNALIADSSLTPQKQNWDMINPTPIWHIHPLSTQSLGDIDKDATHEIWRQHEFMYNAPQQIPKGNMFGESGSLFGKNGESHLHVYNVDDGGMFFALAKDDISDSEFGSEFAPIKIGRQDIPLLDFIKSDKIWRRLTRTVLEQSLATLRSSQGLIVF